MPLPGYTKGQRQLGRTSGQPHNGPFSHEDATRRWMYKLEVVEGTCFTNCHALPVCIDSTDGTLGVQMYGTRDFHATRSTL